MYRNFKRAIFYNVIKRLIAWSCNIPSNEIQCYKLCGQRCKVEFEQHRGVENNSYIFLQSYVEIRIVSSNMIISSPFCLSSEIFSLPLYSIVTLWMNKHILRQSKTGYKVSVSKEVFYQLLWCSRIVSLKCKWFSIFVWIEENI